MKSNWAARPLDADEIKFFYNDDKPTKRFFLSECFEILSSLSKNLISSAVGDLGCPI